MSVRTATQSDLPALRSILLTGLPSDHVWKYCFPLGRGGAVQLVDDALRLWLDGGKKAAGDRNQWLVTVSDDPETGKPASLAVWSLPQSAEDLEGDEGADFVAFRSSLSQKTVAEPANQPDADGDAEATAAPNHNPEAPPPPPPLGKEEASSAARLTALASALQRATRGGPDGVLLARYGPQMVLLLTATLPSRRFRGHARALVAHGVSLASRYRLPQSGSQHQQQQQQQGVAVSALAGPMGYIFFSGLRFSDCGLVTVRAEGEREELDLKVMVQAPPPARRSFSQQLMGLFGGAAADGRNSRGLPAADDAKGRGSSRGSSTRGSSSRRPSAFEERKMSAA